MRRFAAALAVVLTVAACGDDGAMTTAAPAATDSTPVSTTVAEPPAADPTTETSPGSPGGGEPTTSTAADTPAVTVDPSLPDAADFTLPLGGGGSFTLSDEQKPVYMVFWAEW